MDKEKIYLELDYIIEFDDIPENAEDELVDLIIEWAEKHNGMVAGIIGKVTAKELEERE